MSRSGINQRTIDLPAARAFVATSGRILDRRRVEVVLDGAPAGGLLAALDGYRNDDGGYGWGLEPDLRSPESQPTAAMHAFELLAEIGAAGAARAGGLCDWLDRHILPDGGLPFALAVTDPAGCAPWWLDPDTGTSSLQMTAQVAANAHLVARHTPAVREHRWLGRATRWCLDAVAGLDEAPHAYELLFAIRFLDAAAPVEPEADALLDRVGRFVPGDGVVPVAGGVEGEAVRALDLAPRPGPSRRLFTADVVEAELRRLAGQQREDGGWTVDFPSASPAAALEWRAYATVQALLVLGAAAPA
jgi:hypothetical protein